MCEEASQGRWEKVSPRSLSSFPLPTRRGVSRPARGTALRGARPGALPVLGTVQGAPGSLGKRGVLWKVPRRSGEPHRELGASKNEAGAVVNDVLS